MLAKMNTHNRGIRIAEPVQSERNRFHGVSRHWSHKNLFMLLSVTAVLFLQPLRLWADTDTDAASSGSALPADAMVGADSGAQSDTGSDDSSTAAPMTTPAPVPLKNEIPEERMPEVNVTVTPKKCAIGDLIEWKVEVHKKSPEDRVVLPSSFDFGKLEIQSRNIGETKDDERSMTQVLGIGLVSFETGDFEIPPQKLTVVDKDGNLSEIMSPAFKVTVTSLIANAPEPKLKVDQKGGEVVMVKDYTLLYIAIGIGGAILIVLLTLLVRKLLSMRKPKPGPPPPPPRPAHEVALEKLNALKYSGYLDEQMHKTFHLKLSEAFREYLGNRYHFDALECSTREIVDELRRLALKLELHREVVQLLEDTDLVKFAKYVPPKEESEGLLDEAFRLVNVTMEKPPLPKGPAIEQVDGGQK